MEPFKAIVFWPEISGVIRDTKEGGLRIILEIPPGQSAMILPAFRMGTAGKLLSMTLEPKQDEMIGVSPEMHYQELESRLYN